MAEPLLFVCISTAVSPGSRLARASLLTLEIPGGPVHLAFGSREVAAVIIGMFGTANGAFVVPETRLVPEVAPPGGLGRVFVVNSVDDYYAVTGPEPGFPWSEHIITFDFAAAAARASVSRDDFGSVPEGSPPTHA